MKELDITHLKTEDKLKLKEEIYHMVKDTQRVIIQPYPHELLMTREQYDLLQDDPEMQGMYKSNDRVYITPDNAMEVVIK